MLGKIQIRRKMRKIYPAGPVSNINACLKKKPRIPKLMEAVLTEQRQNVFMLSASYGAVSSWVSKVVLCFVPFYSQEMSPLICHRYTAGTLIAITWSPITKYLITIKWSQNIWKQKQFITKAVHYKSSSLQSLSNITASDTYAYP